MTIEEQHAARAYEELIQGKGVNERNDYQIDELSDEYKTMERDLYDAVLRAFKTPNQIKQLTA